MYKSKSKQNLHADGEGAKEWDIAITDAKDMISEYKERIERLNRAIKTFSAMRDKGERFPRARAGKDVNKATEATI